MTEKSSESAKDDQTSSSFQNLFSLLDTCFPDDVVLVSSINKDLCVILPDASTGTVACFLSCLVFLT